MPTYGLIGSQQSESLDYSQLYERNERNRSHLIQSVPRNRTNYQSNKEWNVDEMTSKVMASHM